jgi:hypothetical protein
VRAGPGWPDRADLEPPGAWPALGLRPQRSSPTCRSGS